MRSALRITVFLIAFAATAEEIPVSLPRLAPAPGQRLDGDLVSKGKSAFATWVDRRLIGVVFASRIGPGGEVLDPYGIRIPTLEGFYVDQPVAAIGDETTLVAMHVWGSQTNRIGVVRVAADGSLADRMLKIIGEGTSPSVATNGSTFLVASTCCTTHHPTTQSSVELTLLSSRLELLSTTRISGTVGQVAALGDRYLCTFLKDGIVSGVIVENGAFGEPFPIGKAGPYDLRAAALTATGEAWKVAIASEEIRLCSVTAAHAVSCRTVARPDPSKQMYMSDIVPAGDDVVLSWFSEKAIQHLTEPPRLEFDAHLTRVTPDAVRELDPSPRSDPADDDVLMLREGGEAMRVGRTGVVAHIPVALGAPEQLLERLLPSGDGATAFWGEVTPAGDAYSLHATRFTEQGIDERVHDRELGRAVKPLGSDGRNVLLSDGRVLDPSGETVRRIEMPEGASDAGWDGREWVVVSDRSVRRGKETLNLSAGFPRGLACADGACVLAWIETKSGPGPTDWKVSVRAAYLAGHRQLSRARPVLLAEGIGDHQSIGVAAAGGAFLVAWPGAREVRGRIFTRRGRLSDTLFLGGPVSATDPLFFETGNAHGNFVLVRNNWPTMRVVHISPSGTVLSSSDLQNGTARGVAAAGGRTLVFYERPAPEPPWASTRRAFVAFVP